jgi:hypothetical protein
MATRYAQDPTQQILALGRTAGENGQPSCEYGNYDNLVSAAAWVHGA